MTEGQKIQIIYKRFVKKERMNICEKVNEHRDIFGKSRGENIFDDKGFNYKRLLEHIVFQRSSKNFNLENKWKNMDENLFNPEDNDITRPGLWEVIKS